MVYFDFSELSSAFPKLANWPPFSGTFLGQSLPALDRGLRRIKSLLDCSDTRPGERNPLRISASLATSRVWGQLQTHLPSICLLSVDRSHFPFSLSPGTECWRCWHSKSVAMYNILLLIRPARRGQNGSQIGMNLHTDLETGNVFFFFLSFIRVRKAFLKSIAATVRKFQGYISMCTYNSDWPSSSSLPATKIEMLFYGLHGLADMPGGKTVESFSSLILQDQDQERERRGKIKSALIGHKIPLLNTAALLHVVVGIW